jgi:hypothetical protein
MAVVRIHTIYAVRKLRTFSFVATNNLFNFDCSSVSSPAFYAQGGCTYSGGFAYTTYQEWNSNLHWRTDGAFAADPQASKSSLAPAPRNPAPSTAGPSTPSPSRSKKPAKMSKASAKPRLRQADLPCGRVLSPQGLPRNRFHPLRPYIQSGRTNPVIKPPSIQATFATKPLNPATDY